MWMTDIIILHALLEWAAAIADEGRVATEGEGAREQQMYSICNKINKKRKGSNNKLVTRTNMSRTLRPSKLLFWSLVIVYVY